MKAEHDWVRISIAFLTGFVALSAMAGGLGMLQGADRFPQEWLGTTPFNDYTIPALLLVLVVGGSSLFAAVTIITGRKGGVLASMAAGLLLVGFIVAELAILNDNELISGIEGMYLAIGLVIFGLAAHLGLIEGQAPKASSIEQRPKQVSHL